MFINKPTKRSVIKIIFVMCAAVQAYSFMPSILLDDPCITLQPTNVLFILR